MGNLLTKVKKKYINLRGFHTNRKLVVIESDDWGSIRMPSRTTFEYLQSLGDFPEKDGFLSNDSLESESDLQALFDVLSSISDSKGNHPIITANFAMANPDFDSIDYKRGIYNYEPFYITYQKYYGKNRILELIKDGYKQKLFLPQLHCREHLNVGRWMYDLHNNKQHTLIAFENKMLGIQRSFQSNNPFGYMDAFNTDFASEIELHKILKDAHAIFVDVFGYKSLSFVASCFVWADSLETSLREQGIHYIQSASWQNKPVGKNGKYKLKRKIRFTGQKNKNNQIYSVRNCSFEPAYNQNPQVCVNNCLCEIEESFKAKKPAIINSHRFNYIGTINSKNRENNLMGLKSLLNSIVQIYSDVEFISSVELFSIMEEVRK